jgi:hypothetical protein
MANKQKAKDIKKLQERVKSIREKIDEVNNEHHSLHDFYYGECVASPFEAVDLDLIDGVIKTMYDCIDVLDSRIEAYSQ